MVLLNMVFGSFGFSQSDKETFIVTDKQYFYDTTVTIHIFIVFTKACIK